MSVATHRRDPRRSGRIAAAGGVTVEALRDGTAPRWLQDGAWEEAVALLRAVWQDASRRALVMRPLRSLG